MRLTVLGCCCSKPATATATATASFPKSPTNRNPSNRFPARSTSVATAGTEASDEPSSVALPLLRRRLILLRHAESTFVGSRVKDHERPLSKPGRRDAMSVAHKLEQMGWIPEVILSRLGFAS